MDNLTHSLTGLLLSRAGLGKLHPRAALILVLAANAPDIDGVSLFFDKLAYLEQHRGYTHSALLIPLVALLPVLAARLFARHFRWLPAWLLAMAGVASHLLLDWTNVYGIRLLLPVSTEWFHLDLNNLIDLWIWAVLLFATIAPLIGRLVSSEIGARPGSGRPLAVFALLLISGYDFGRFLLRERVIAMLESRVYQEGPALRYAAWPPSSNPLEWTGYVETATTHHSWTLNATGDFDPGAGKVLYKPEPSPALDAARNSPALRAYLRFARFPLWRVTPVAEPSGGTRVEVMDLRFGIPPPPRFLVETILDGQLQVVKSEFRF